MASGSARKLQAPKGTLDALPGENALRERLESEAARLFESAGYGRIETPAFEDAELFVRSVGEATDIVRKEMFTFEDAGSRSLALRPEGTAPICRAYVEHGMHKLPQPVKLWYSGPFFRGERPQKGRYRQFSQVGAEAIGTDSPLADAESIALLDDLLKALAVPGVELRLGSLGSPASRAAYRDELRDYLRAHEAELSDEVRSRIDANPLRAFDADHPGTRAAMEGAPTMLDRLDPADAEHFAEVRSLLDDAGIAYVLDGTLVRGLDYYSRTVFEFTSDRLGAQSALGGGGRYDGLVEQLGGPPAPAVGWAAGIERILLAIGAEAPSPITDAFVVADPAHARQAAALVRELRGAGLRAEHDLAGRSNKGQMKQADRAGARVALILGDDGITLRDMRTGEQRSAEPGSIVAELQGYAGD